MKRLFTTMAAIAAVVMTAGTAKAAEELFIYNWTE